MTKLHFIEIINPTSSFKKLHLNTISHLVKNGSNLEVKSQTKQSTSSGSGRPALWQNQMFKKRSTDCHK